MKKSIASIVIAVLLFTATTYNDFAAADYYDGSVSKETELAVIWGFYEGGVFYTPVTQKLKLKLWSCFNLDNTHVNVVKTGMRLTRVDYEHQQTMLSQVFQPCSEYYRDSTQLKKLFNFNVYNTKSGFDYYTDFESFETFFWGYHLGSNIMKSKGSVGVTTAGAIVPGIDITVEQRYSPSGWD